MYREHVLILTYIHFVQHQAIVEAIVAFSIGPSGHTLVRLYWTLNAFQWWKWQCLKKWPSYVRAWHVWGHSFYLPFQHQHIVSQLLLFHGRCPRQIFNRLTAFCFQTIMTLKPHLNLVTRDAASQGISLLQLVGLAHLYLHNMADILQKKISNAFSKGKYNILI